MCDARLVEFGGSVGVIEVPGVEARERVIAEGLGNVRVGVKAKVISRIKQPRVCEYL